MTLTLDTLPARFGPGIGIRIFIPAGPIPLDDFVTITARSVASPAYQTYGDRITHGLLTIFTRLGITEHQPAPQSLFGGMPDGEPLELQALQAHANGTLVDSSAWTAGTTWDPTSGLFLLVNNSTAAGTVGAMLAEIRDAVKHTFPATS